MSPWCCHSCQDLEGCEGLQKKKKNNLPNDFMSQKKKQKKKNMPTSDSTAVKEFPKTNQKTA